MPSLRAGSLNHRIEIHERGSVQDEVTGNITETWPLFAEAWANVRPQSAREFIAGGAEASRLMVEVRLRYLDGIVPSMRVRHGDKLYNIEGVIPDPYSGREWLTLACSEIQQ